MAGSRRNGNGAGDDADELGAAYATGVFAPPIPPDEQVRPYRERRTRPEGEALRRRLAAWADRHGAELPDEPELPPGIHAVDGRDAEIASALSELAASGDAARLPRSITMRNGA